MEITILVQPTTPALTTKVNTHKALAHILVCLLLVWLPPSFFLLQFCTLSPQACQASILYHIAPAQSTFYFLSWDNLTKLFRLAFNGVNFLSLLRQELEASITRSSMALTFCTSRETMPLNISNLLQPDGITEPVSLIKPISSVSLRELPAMMCILCLPCYSHWALQMWLVQLQTWVLYSYFN